MAVLDNVPAFQVQGRKPLTSPPPSTGDKVNQQTPLWARLMDNLTSTLMPSGFTEGAKEKNTLKATGQFIKGLGQSAILLPQGLYQEGKQLIQEVTAPQGQGPISQQIQEGLKEGGWQKPGLYNKIGGLSSGFLTGLSTTLPMMATFLGGLKLPANPTPAQVAEVFTLGGPLSEKPVIQSEAKLPEVKPSERVVVKVGKENVVTAKEVPQNVPTTNVLDLTPIKILDEKIALAKEGIAKLKAEVNEDPLINESKVNELQNTLKDFQKRRQSFVSNVKAVTQDIQPPKPGQERTINVLPEKVKEQIISDNTPPVQPGAVGNFRSVEGRLNQAGPAGRQLVDQIRNYLEQPGLQAAALETDLKPYLLGLSRDEIFNLKAVLQGKGEPISIQVADAAKLARGQMDVIAGLAKEKVPGFTPRQDYMPQTLPGVTELENKAVRSDIIDNMVEFDKSVSSRAEAEGLLNAWETYLKTNRVTQPLIDYVEKTKQLNIPDKATFMNELQNRLNLYTRPSVKFGAFQPRTLDLPFYDPNPARVLTSYYRGAFEYFHKLDNWGPAGQKLFDLVNIIRQQGGDAKFADNVVKFLMEGDQADMAFESLRRGLMRYNTTTKMPLSFIANSMQGFTGTALYSNVKTAIKALKNTWNEELRTFAESTGGLSDSHLSSVLQGTFGVDVSTGLAAKVLKPFKVTEINNFYTSVIGGKFFLEDLANMLKKNPTDAYALRKLKDLKFTDTEISKIMKSGFTPDQLRLGALRFWEKSQGIPSVLNIPLVAQQGWGTLFAQFRRVAYNQGRLIWDGVVKELRHGNPYPLMTLMVMFPAIGEIIADVKTLLRGQGFKDDKSLLTNPTVANYFDRMGEAFGLGLAADLYEAATQPEGVMKFIGGPTATLANDAAYAAATVYKKPRNMIKFLLNQVPFVGQPMKNIIFPPEASAAELPVENLPPGFTTITDKTTGKKLTLGTADLEKIPVTPVKKNVGIISGIDIGRYATDPKHEVKVQMIYNNMPDINSAADIDNYIKSKFRKSPIAGWMVLNAASEYNIDPKLLIAIMQQDSGLGTVGQGARNNNPGNVATYGNKRFVYKNWAEGVRGAARALNRFRIKT
jgi:hypothetical protein